MEKQALIIGLGQFGLALARSLTELHVEVIAVDRVHAAVQAASSFAAQAVRLDATDEEALASLDPARRDFCICTIGDQSRESAILVTALLRQLGAPYVMTRASDPLMERILGLVGAHEVVNPERAFGERLARRLTQPEMVAEVPLGRDLVVSELRPRPSMVGRSLIDLELPRRFGITVLAVRPSQGNGPHPVLLPDPARPIDAHDILVIVARPGATRELDDKW